MYPTVRTEDENIQLILEHPAIKDRRQWFGVLLSLQHELNSLARADVPEYLQASYPWHEAILDECQEASTHMGWKWWKNCEEVNFRDYYYRSIQSEEAAQLALEFIDQLHFVLSLAIQSGLSSGYAVRYANCMQDGMDSTFTGDTVVNLRDLRVINRNIINLSLRVGALYDEDRIRAFSPMAEITDILALLFTNLGRAFGLLNLTSDSVLDLYVPKNVLNAFRWAGGRYANGTYIKIWSDGREDNVHLSELIEEFKATGEPTPAMAGYLRAGLENRYTELNEAA